MARWKPTEEEKQARRVRRRLELAELSEDQADLLPETVCGLSERTMNALLTDGIPGGARREDILPLVLSGRIHPTVNGIPNYGVVSHREVLRWLGLPEDGWGKDTRNPVTERRYVAYLEARGYKVMPPT